MSAQAPLILLVEDSEDDAFFFRHALKRLKFSGTCVHVTNGQEAIDFLEQARKDGQLPEMIFLDLKMPHLNGFEFLAWAGTQTFTPPLRIIVLSGSDHEADVQATRQLGASEYLVKPISAHDLTDRLASLSIPCTEAKAAA